MSVSRDGVVQSARSAVPKPLARYAQSRVVLNRIAAAMGIAIHLVIVLVILALLGRPASFVQGRTLERIAATAVCGTRHALDMVAALAVAAVSVTLAS